MSPVHRSYLRNAGEINHKIFNDNVEIEHLHDRINTNLSHIENLKNTWPLELKKINQDFENLRVEAKQLASLDVKKLVSDFETVNNVVEKIMSATVVLSKEEVEKILGTISQLQQVNTDLTKFKNDLESTNKDILNVRHAIDMFSENSRQIDRKFTTSLSELQTVFDSTKQDILNFQLGVDPIYKNTLDLTNQVNLLKTCLNSTESELSNLKLDVETIYKSTPEIVTALGTLKTLLTNTTNDMGIVNSFIDTLKSDQITNSLEITNLKTLLNSTIEKISEMKRDVETIYKSTPEIVNALGTLKKLINDVNNDLTGLKVSVYTNTNEIVAVQRTPRTCFHVKKDISTIIKLNPQTILSWYTDEQFNISIVSSKQLDIVRISETNLQISYHTEDSRVNSDNKVTHSIAIDKFDHVFKIIFDDNVKLVVGNRIVFKVDIALPTMSTIVSDIWLYVSTFSSCIKPKVASRPIVGYNSPVENVNEFIHAD